MTQELVAYQSIDETMNLGKLLAQSGYFADSRDAAQAVVKVLAGRELGFGPIASMTGVNIIKGKVTLSANLIAAAIKRSGRYNYRVRKMTDTECSIEFFEQGQSIGVSEFTMNDAKNAGLVSGDNWRKFPRNMLFARAISNGAKWYCPDLSGGPLYTPDELGAIVDGETGEVIDAQPVVKGTGPTWPPEPDPNGFDELPSASATTAGGNGKTAPASAHDPSRPWDDNRKAEAVRWAMRRYPEVYGHVKPWQLSLDHLLEKAASEGMDAAQIARAWKNKCENKQAELDAAKDAAAGITHADLDAQAASEAPQF